MAEAIETKLTGFFQILICVHDLLRIFLKMNYSILKTMDSEENTERRTCMCIVTYCMQAVSVESPQKSRQTYFTHINFHKREESSD